MKSRHSTLQVLTKTVRRNVKTLQSNLKVSAYLILEILYITSLEALCSSEGQAMVSYRNGTTETRVKVKQADMI